MTDQDMPAVPAEEAAGEAAMQDWVERGLRRVLPAHVADAPIISERDRRRAILLGCFGGLVLVAPFLAALVLLTSMSWSDLESVGLGLGIVTFWLIFRPDSLLREVLSKVRR